jgi:hypothetical protein
MDICGRSSVTFLACFDDDAAGKILGDQEAAIFDILAG